MSEKKAPAIKKYVTRAMEQVPAVNKYDWKGGTLVREPE